MKHFVLLPLLFLITLPGMGQTMDFAAIKQLLERMDDSLVQGQIYHINYVVTERKTDAFYARATERAKLLRDAVTKAQEETPPAQQDSDFKKHQANRLLMAESIDQDQSTARETTRYADYSVDGTGFYLKQSNAYMKATGEKGTNPPSIYISDGKITTTFYPDLAQAVIQPATERPQVPDDYWTDTAYQFQRKRVSAYMALLTTLSLKEEAGKIVVTGDKPQDRKELCHMELRIDKATFLPESIVFVYYNVLGVLEAKYTKTWQFQKFSGLMLPQTVIDQEYWTDLSGKLSLNSEMTFTINQFALTPVDAKGQLAQMLKGNFNVFDEITGTHYLSGNAASMLDKLSK